MATLEQDYILPPGQTYALVSFIGPECNQKAKQLGMKLRGVFPTIAEAQAHAKKLQQMETVSMDIYVMEMGKWGLIPPDPAKVPDQSFQEDKLEELMKGYRENQEKARQAFQDRKERLKKHGFTPEELAQANALPPAPAEQSRTILSDIPEIVVGDTVSVPTTPAVEIV